MHIVLCSPQSILFNTYYLRTVEDEEEGFRRGLEHSKQLADIICILWIGE